MHGRSTQQILEATRTRFLLSRRRRIVGRRSPQTSHSLFPLHLCNRLLTRGGGLAPASGRQRRVPQIIESTQSAAGGASRRYRRLGSGCSGHSRSYSGRGSCAHSSECTEVGRRLSRADRRKRRCHRLRRLSRNRVQKVKDVSTCGCGFRSNNRGRSESRRSGGSLEVCEVVYGETERGKRSASLLVSGRRMCLPSSTRSEGGAAGIAGALGAGTSSSKSNKSTIGFGAAAGGAAGAGELLAAEDALPFDARAAEEVFGAVVVGRAELETSSSSPASYWSKSPPREEEPLPPRFAVPDPRYRSVLQPAKSAFPDAQNEEKTHTSGIVVVSSTVSPRPGPAVIVITIAPKPSVPPSPAATTSAHRSTAAARNPAILVSILLGFPSFLSYTFDIAEQIGEFLCPVPHYPTISTHQRHLHRYITVRIDGLTVDTLILALLIRVVERTQHLDRRHVAPRIVDDAFRAVLDEVFEQRQCLYVPGDEFVSGGSTKEK